MKSAICAHNDLKRYLSTDNCFNLEEIIKISTLHLSNNTKIQHILHKSILTDKDIRTLTKYPTGIMYLEIGGKIQKKDNKILFMNEYQKSCWDSKENKPYIDMDTANDEDWHLHPWNAVGNGKPNFFSRDDIEDAFENHKTKYLIVGHPFNYNWPIIFILNAKHNKINGKKILFDLISTLENGIPFIDPQIKWSKINKLLSEFNVSLKYGY